MFMERWRDVHGEIHKIGCTLIFVPCFQILSTILFVQTVTVMTMLMYTFAQPD